MADKLGLRNNARNPASISNIEHHDPSGAKKVLIGSAATVKTISANSTTKTAVESLAVLRVANTDTSWQFLFVGKDSDAPGGAPTASNGIALAPGTVEMVFCGVSDDPAESIVFKSSNTAVQVVVMNS